MPGKDGSHPRPEWEIKIGSIVSVDHLLAILSQNDFVTIEEALGVPGGPNSASHATYLQRDIIVATQGQNEISSQTRAMKVALLIRDITY